VSPGLPGFAYKYAAPGLTAPTLTPTGSALAVAAHPGTPTDPSTAWSGVGIGFDACIDGGAYVGIKFTLAGDTGNCGLTVAAAFAENTSPANAPQGTCITEPCYYPSAPVFGTGTITVPFASMFGGNPLTAVDAKTLLGVQWQLNAPADGSCTASFTIADVELVTNVPPPLCTASVPPSPNITGSPSLAFGSYGYVAPGLQAPVVSPIVATDGSLLGLDVSVNPGATTDPGNAWLGAGLSLPGCIDASRYKGVRFTIDGDLGTCSLAFVAVPAQKQPDRSTLPSLNRLPGRSASGFPMSSNRTCSRSTHANPASVAATNPPPARGAMAPMRHGGRHWSVLPLDHSQRQIKGAFMSTQ